MTATEDLGVYLVRVHGCADTREALALQDPVSRLLCPDPEHSGPCDIPWGTSLDGDEDEHVLVLGVYTTASRAAGVAERVRALVGPDRPVDVAEGDPAEQFEELVEQYLVERGL